jgi:RNA polymerase sigma factor (sigma-70 family)
MKIMSLIKKSLTWLQIHPNYLPIRVALMEIVKKYTDAELIEAIKSPKTIDAAIKFLYREYYEQLRIYTCQNSGSVADAQDMFQDVVVAFIELAQRDKFRGESSIKTFLFSMNRNMWLNELKKRGNAEKRNTAFEMGKENADMDISHLIVQNESRKQILAVVNELGETCKKILLAFYYENLPMKEILTNLHYESEQAVRNKKCKCLKQLEQLLSAHPNLEKILKNALQYE